MPEVNSFNQIIDFLVSKGIEKSEAIHKAEAFMDKQSINFDADGNFDSINISYNGELKKI